MIGHNSAGSLGQDGWIAISRKMRGHWLVGFGQQPLTAVDPKRGAYSRAEAWIDLIMECRYADGTVNNNGRKMALRQGQMMGATLWLACRWNWTRKTVRVFLDKLQDEGMIARIDPCSHEVQGEASKGQLRGRFANVISVCNYSFYQLPDRHEGPVAGTARGQLRASSGPVEGHIYKDNKGTREQGNTPQDSSSLGGVVLDKFKNVSNGHGAQMGQLAPHEGGASPSAPDTLGDRLAREAMERGARIKQGVATKSAPRPKGELDGSRGIAFNDGKLSVMNGAAAALAGDFPDLDIGAVCNSAGPYVAKLRHPRFDDAMALLRRSAQWLRDDAGKRPAGGKPSPGFDGLSLERRARIAAAKKAAEAAHA